jgi:hypothetical protein
VYRLEHHAGRLVELSGGVLTSSVEHERMVSELRGFSDKIGKPLVLACDSRAAAPVPPSVFAKLVNGMRTVNSKIERSAILVPRSGNVKLQLETAVREAGNPSRRVFTSTEKLKAWLSEVLDPGERARLDQFLPNDGA